MTCELCEVEKSFANCETCSMEFCKECDKQYHTPAKFKNHVRRPVSKKEKEDDIIVSGSDSDIEIELDLDDVSSPPKKNTTLATKKEKCEVCMDADAAVFCRDCDMGFCNANGCNKQMHDGALSNSHNIVDIKDKHVKKDMRKSSSKSSLTRESTSTRELDQRVIRASVGIAPKTIERYVEVFISFVKSKGSSMSREKFIYACRELERKESREELTTLFKKYDKNGSDSIDLAEFIIAVSAKDKTTKLENYDTELLKASQGLSSEEVSKFRKAFSVFDKSGSGTVTRDELFQTLKDLGQNPTHDEVDDLMFEVDKDNSGSIDFPEFLTMMKNRMAKKNGGKPSYEARLKEASIGLSQQDITKYRTAFEVFDRNGSGKITEDDLYEAMVKLGHSNNRAAVAKVMREIDTDGSGSIDFPEFITMMAKKQFGNSPAPIVSRHISNADDVDFKRRVAAASVGLRNDEISKFRATFDKFDASNDGHISRSELSNAMRNLGHNPTTQSIDKLLEKVDLNRDGYIDWPEFLRMMKNQLEQRELNKSDTPKNASWKTWKEEKSGAFDRKVGGRNFQTRFKEASEFLTKAEVAKFREAFNRFDSDNSGTVSSAELYKVFREAGQKPTQAEDSVASVLAKAKESGDAHDEIDFPQFLYALGKDLRESRGRELEVAMDGLPSSKVEKFREIFHKSDKDKSGTVSDTELYQVFRDAGQRPADAEKAVKLVMANGKKSEVTFAEFLTAMKNITSGGSNERPTSTPVTSFNSSSNSNNDILLQASKFLYKSEIVRFKQAFDKFDTDGSGTVDSNELYKVFRDAGQRPNEAEESAQAVFKQANKSSNSDINFGEFLMVMGKNLREERSAQLEKATAGLSLEALNKYKAIFERFDTDNSGTVSRQELYKMFREFGQSPKDAEDSVAKIVNTMQSEGSSGTEEFTFRDFVGAIAKNKQDNNQEEKTRIDHAGRDLSKAEIIALKEAFDSFDADKSGTVSQAELYKVFRKAGQTPADAEVSTNEILTSGSTTDKLSEITFGHFLEYMGDKIRAKKFGNIRKVTRGMSREEVNKMQTVFDSFDKDKSGTVDSEELYKVFREAGQSPSLAESSTQEVLKNAADKESGITFIEFVEYLAKKKRKDNPYAEYEEDDEPKFDERKISDLKRVFNTFDTNGDGQMNLKELKQLLIKLGDRPTSLELRRIMDSADTDGNGTLNFKEFLGFYSIFRKREDTYEERLRKARRNLSLDQQRILKKAFDEIDTNGNREIEVKELARCLKNAGKLITPKILRETMAEGDKNKDGVIDYPEFLELMGKTMKCENLIRKKTMHAADGLTNEQVAKFHEAFNTLDKNGVGYITVKDIAAVMRTAGKRPSASQLKEIMAEADEDGNGKLDFPEFLNLMGKKLKGTYDNRLKIAEQDLTNKQIANYRRMFDSCDSNENDTIEARELAALLRSTRPDITASEIRQIMEKADTNNDSVIDFPEFLELVKPPSSKYKREPSKLDAASAGLTTEQVEKFKEAFDTFDRKKTGEITVSDLATVMRSSGQRPSVEKLKSIMAEADEDGSGTIDFPEFLNLMGKHAKEENVKTAKLEAATHGLTDEQVEKFREAFNVFDTKSNGEITVKDIAQAMRKSGQNPTAAQLKNIMAEADEDGSGTIDFPEFLNMMSKEIKIENDYNERLANAKKYLTQEQIDKFSSAFDEFDSNKNGKIELRELSKVMRAAGERPTPSKLNQIMEEADINKDGVIDFPEFINLMGKHVQQAGKEVKASENLTKKQIAQFKEAFEVFDPKGTGKITVKQLANVLRKSGKQVTAKELQDIMNEADEDGDGTIDFPEFLNLMGKRAKAENTLDDRVAEVEKYLTKKQRVVFRESFDKFDINGDGFITRRELKKILSLTEDYSEKKISKIMSEADENKDDRIDYAEFLTLMAGDHIKKATYEEKLNKAKKLLARKDLIAFKKAFEAQDRLMNGEITSSNVDKSLRSLVIDKVITREQAKNAKKNSQTYFDNNKLVKLADYLLFFTSEKEDVISKKTESAERKLTKRQLRDFTQSFKDLDLNGDGVLDVRELRVMLKKSGVKPSPSKVEEIMKEADINRDHKIELREFIVLMAKHFGKGNDDDESDVEPETGLNEREMAHLEKSFDHFDEDNEGFLPTKTLYKVIRHFRDGERMSVNEFKEIVREIDPNNRGEVRRSVFLMYMDDRTRKTRVKDKFRHKMEKVTRGINKETLKKIEELFLEYSVDEDESIDIAKMSIRRIGKIFRGLEVDIESETLKNIVKNAKTSDDGMVTFIQCLQMIAPVIQNEITKKRLAEVTADMTKDDVLKAKTEFDRFDLDGSNSISSKELGNVMRKMGHPMSRDEIRSIIEDGDCNNDGTIDFAEFLIMLNVRKQQEEEANMTPEERQAREEHKAMLEKEKEMEETFLRLGMTEEYEKLIKDRAEREKEEEKARKERAQYKKLGMMAEYEQLLKDRKKEKAKASLKASLVGIFRFNARLLKNTFDEFDDDEDSRVSHKEMFKVLTRLKPKFRLHDMVSMMNDFKVDDDGLIGYSEFVCGIAPSVRKFQNTLDEDERLDLVSEGIAKEQLLSIRESFDLFDKNGNGKINLKELGKLLKSIRVKTDAKTLKTAMTELDVNEDGQIEFAEFVDFAADRIKAKLDREKANEEACEGLTPQQATQFRKAFGVYDMNDTGAVNVTNLRRLLADLKMPNSRSDVAKVQREMDIKKRVSKLGKQESVFTLGAFVNAAAEDLKIANKKSERSKLQRQKKLQHKKEKMVEQASKHLSRKQIREYQEAFDEYDLDQNGTISTKELYKVLKRAGEHLTSDEISSLMKEADIDKSGTMDFGEFLVLCSSHSKKHKKKSKHGKSSHKNRRGSTSKSSRSVNDIPQCSVCDSCIAEVYCMDCEEYFCIENDCDADMHEDEDMSFHKRKSVKSSSRSYGSDSDSSEGSNSVSVSEYNSDSNSSDISGSESESVSVSSSSSHGQTRRNVRSSMKSKAHSSPSKSARGRKLEKPIGNNVSKLFNKDDLAKYKKVFKKFCKMSRNVAIMPPINLVKALASLKFKLSLEQGVELMEQYTDKKITLEVFLVEVNKQRRNKKSQKENITRSTVTIPKTLSKSQIQELRYMFDQFDHNYDGHISAEELYKTFRDMGMSSTEANSKSKRALEEYDLNGDSKITFEEFARIMSSYSRFGQENAASESKKKNQSFEAVSRGLSAQQLKALKECFDLYDRKNDKRIHINDITNCIKALDFNVNPDELIELIDNTPIDQDGCVSWNNYVGMLRKYSIAHRVSKPNNISATIPNDVQAELQRLQNEIIKLREEKKHNEHSSSRRTPPKSTTSSKTPSYASKTTRPSSTRSSYNTHQRLSGSSTTAINNNKPLRAKQLSKETMARLTGPVRKSTRKISSAQQQANDKKTVDQLRDQAKKLRVNTLSNYLPGEDVAANIMDDIGFSDTASIASTIQPPTDEANLAVAITELTRSLERSRRRENKMKKKIVTERLSRTHAHPQPFQDSEGVLYHPEVRNDVTMGPNDTTVLQPQGPMEEHDRTSNNNIARYAWSENNNPDSAKVDEIDGILDNLRKQSQYYEEILSLKETTKHSPNHSPRRRAKTPRVRKSTKDVSSRTQLHTSRSSRSMAPGNVTVSVVTSPKHKTHKKKSKKHSEVDSEGEFYSIDFDKFASKLESSPADALDWLTRKQKALLNKSKHHK